MAASEGQLAIEFVQALTAEARAHREYLQLLYSITLGVVGGGLLLIAGALAWLAQRNLVRAKEEIKEQFDSQASALFAAAEADIAKRLKKYESRIVENEEAAKEKLDDVVSFSLSQRFEKSDLKMTACLVSDDDFIRDTELFHILGQIGFAIDIITLQELGARNIQYLKDKLIVIDGDCDLPESVRDVASSLAAFREDLVHIYFDRYSERVPEVRGGHPKVKILVGPSDLLAAAYRFEAVSSDEP